MAKSYAREFTGHGLRALQFSREAVQRSLDVTLQEGLRIEADLSTLAGRQGANKPIHSPTDAPLLAKFEEVYAAFENSTRCDD